MNTDTSPHNHRLYRIGKISQGDPELFGAYLRLLKTTYAPLGFFQKEAVMAKIRQRCTARQTCPA